MMTAAFKKVFTKGKYVLLASCVSAVAFVIAVWFPNLRLIAAVWMSDVSFAAKAELPLSLLGAIGTNFTLLTATYTIIIALLFGVYISMLTYFLSHRIKQARSGASTGFFGILSGVLGVGCAACGSFLLTSLSLVGATGVLSVLPLQGGEFGILGALLLGLAIYMTAKKIQSPQICKA
jgi:hypothetical protein